MDLVTIAGLATWTDRVVSKVGREHLESLLEISRIRGRLPDEIREMIRTLALLFDVDGAESGLTAKELVSLLAQLDALSESGTSADTKMLSFLIQGNLEGFPLIQP